MSEFTKGELQIILLEMNISIGRAPPQLTVSPVYFALRNKVESMIDNYPKICGLCNQINCQECSCR